MGQLSRRVVRFIILLLSPLLLLAQPPGLFKAIKENRKQILISTDSFSGSRPIEAALDAGFGEIHAIDLHMGEHLASIARFSNEPKIHLYQHDSPPILTAILSSIHEPVLFWFNGFRRGALTIWGKKIDEGSSILRELAVLANHPIKTHTLLIGDIESIGTHLFNGLKIEELIEAIRKINPKYQILFQDEGRILRATVEEM